MIKVTLVERAANFRSLTYFCPSDLEVRAFVSLVETWNLCGSIEFDLVIERESDSDQA